MYLMQLSRPSRVKIDNGQNVAFIIYYNPDCMEA